MVSGSFSFVLVFSLGAVGLFVWRANRVFPAFTPALCQERQGTSDILRPIRSCPTSTRHPPQLFIVHNRQTSPIRRDYQVQSANYVSKSPTHQTAHLPRAQNWQFPPVVACSFFLWVHIDLDLDFDLESIIRAATASPTIVTSVQQGLLYGLAVFLRPYLRRGSNVDFSTRAIGMVSSCGEQKEIVIEYNRERVVR